MSTEQNFPNILDEHKISDAIFAEAYQKVSDEQRALIKTSIAFHFNTQTQIHEQTKFIKNKFSGFNFEESKKVSPFLICLLEKNFTSPARLLAVLCPAVIAGIENIYILTERKSESILASLELCGLENIYYLTDFNDHTFLINQTIKSLIAAQKEKGRLVFFHQDNITLPYQNNLSKFTKLEIKSFCDYSKPRLYANEENLKALEFAYGLGCNIFTPNYAKSQAHNSDQTNEEINSMTSISFDQDQKAEQNYSKNMELCYLNPMINTSYFFNKQISSWR